MPSPEKITYNQLESESGERSRLLGFYEKINRVTFVGALGVAGIAAITPGLQSLVYPAVLWATVDGAQILVINRINKKPTKSEYSLKQTSEYSKTLNEISSIQKKPDENVIFLSNAQNKERNLAEAA